MQAQTCTNNKQLKPVCKKTAKPRAQGQSEKTQWSYWMQAIEPTDPDIEQAFPGYHPLWVQQSQKLTVGPVNLKHLRRHCLNVTQAQVAAYLRVKLRKYQAWERGDQPAPFMAFELLRLVYTSTAYRLSHAIWDGWHFGKDGCLVSPNVGRQEVGPEDFTALVFLRGELETHRLENARYKADMAALEAENIRLRQAFRENAITNELEAMQTRLGDLLASIQTAQVIPFPTRQARMEAAA
ncbi:MAG: hypothetical protein Q8Q28_10395 [Pseudomonadota bacterium]|nr:hypothetical protein [Pseudomonadota bacterium]